MESRRPVIQLDDVHPTHKQDPVMFGANVDTKAEDERDASTFRVEEGWKVVPFVLTLTSDNNWDGEEGELRVKADDVLMLPPCAVDEAKSIIYLFKIVVGGDNAERVVLRVKLLVMIDKRDGEAGSAFRKD